MPPSSRRPTAPWSAAVILTGLGLAGTAAIGCSAIGGVKAKAPPAAAQAASPYVAVAEGKADVEGGIIQVASRTAGVVRDVEVLEGDHVTRGEVLARQEDDAPRLAVQTAQASLAQAQAQLGVTQVQRAAALREKARLGALDGVVSRQQVDQAGDAILSADAALDAERAAIGVARTELAEARYRLEQTIIRAPADGVIVRRYANPGSGASTLNVTPMFDLEPAGARIVRAEVTETALPTVTIGQGVRISPESDPSKAWPGRVLREAAVFGARKLQSDDPAERTDERVVEVVVSADGAPFLVGQRVLVKFVAAGAKS
jgi:HlyD family secretion protein